MTKKTKNRLSDYSVRMLSPVLALLLFPPGGLIRAFAAEGMRTIGIAAAQLYSDEQPNKRGVLIVRRVDSGSAAADAGIHMGDIIVSVNGSPVAGRDSSEIVRKDFRGPVGGSVHLAIARLDGGQSEIVLARKPYPPHINPASDAFRYLVPGSWRMDLRYKFPLPRSPSIPYQGLEDLAFAPNFDDTSSAEYHSYLILRWLEGAVTIYDRHDNVIKLHSEVTTSVCAATNHTAVFSGCPLNHVLRQFGLS
jgi:hypothetical protein